MTAPASPLSSRSGPERLDRLAGRSSGVTRIAENAAMPPAIAHARVAIRRAGMPSSSAVSGVVGGGPHRHARAGGGGGTGTARPAAPAPAPASRCTAGRSGSVPISKVGQARRLREGEAADPVAVDEQRHHQDELGQPERGDHADQRRTVRRAAGRPRPRRRRPSAPATAIAHREGQPVRRPEVDDEQAEHRGAERADRAVREVDEPAGPVDQDQPDREQAVGQAGEDADDEPVRRRRRSRRPATSALTSPPTRDRRASAPGAARDRPAARRRSPRR